jgi:hemerythrin
MFEWDDKNSLGIKIIDDQHKRLFEIGSSLYELLSTRGEEDIFDEIVEIIERLKTYTVFHFETEEDLLEKYNYEHVQSHIDKHTKFVDTLNDIDLKSLDDDQKSHGMKLLKFIIDWIFKHIHSEDFMYRDTLIGKVN